MRDGARLLIVLVMPALCLGDADFFETRVRPVLARRCFSCHADSALSGLRVDSRTGLLAGGKAGPAMVPGQASQSLLIQAVEHSHPRFKMPPQGKLDAGEVADLRRWIDSGAAWPAAAIAPVPAVSVKTISAEQRALRRRHETEFKSR